MKKTFPQFFRSVKENAIDPEHYAELLKKPFYSALIYLYFLIFILSVFQVLFVVVRLAAFLPLLPVYTANIKKAVQVAYPSELTVTIKNGVLSANVDQPYYIDVPQLKQDNGPTHFITIDSQASVDEYPTTNSIFLLTQNSFVYPDKDTPKGNYRVYPWKSLEKDMVIDKNGYDSVAEKILPFVNYLSGFLIALTIILAIIAPFFLALFIGIGKLLYLLVASLILFIIAKMMGRKLTYGKVYTLAVYGLTAPILLSFIQSYLPEPAESTGLIYTVYHNLYTLLFFIFMILVLRSLSVKKPK
jgi:hypothetical protein